MKNPMKHLKEPCESGYYTKKKKERKLLKNFQRNK